VQLVVAWTATLLAASCGSNPNTAAGPGDDGFGAGANGSGGSGSGGSGGAAADGGGPDLNGGGGGAASVRTLEIEPVNPTLIVTGSPDTLQLTVKYDNGDVPPSANWSLDDVAVGTISDVGLFTSPGLIAGDAVVTARVGNKEATTTVTIQVEMSENPGGVSVGDQSLLQSGGAADSAFRWLYPYDGTIFPRGLAAPLLQFGGEAADALLLEIEFPGFSYQGFFAGADPSRITLPDAVWNAVTKSAGGTTSVEVSVSKLTGGAASGPVTQHWTIAQGSLVGMVYYNTYRSELTSTGAVMRIRPGESAEPLLDGCTVCHSVSANGNVLVTGLDWAGGNPVDSGSFDLNADGTATSRFTDPDGRKMSFGGLTPNGEWMLSNGVVGAVRGLSGDYPSRLFDTNTGAEVPAPSFTDHVDYALTPAFAPDGSRVAFNWHEQGGKTLAVMDFDSTQSPPAFSNLDTLTTSTEVVGWPAFTPDAAAVVYHEGDRFDTEGSNAEIRLIDIASKTISAANALNGNDSNGNTYLPYGDSEEGRLNYEPTVLPVAVGGYYWAFFTSRRAYGNMIAPGGTVQDGHDKFRENSPRKKIWVAAIDIDYAGKPDATHPAFYLPGQELESGNMRAFAALAPCKPQGESCESGADCCDGFCRQTGTDETGAPILQCEPADGECSNDGETCETAADCCEEGYLCLNGRCAQPTPQ
jgi:hypothetical protein